MRIELIKLVMIKKLIKIVQRPAQRNFSLDKWRAAATKELKGKAPTVLEKETKEAMKLKPVYSAQDLPQDLNSALYPGKSRSQNIG